MLTIFNTYTLLPLCFKKIYFRKGLLQMDRLLTEKIRAEVLNSGMDLIGFAPVGRWKMHLIC